MVYINVCEYKLWLSLLWCYSPTTKNFAPNSFIKIIQVVILFNYTKIVAP